MSDFSDLAMEDLTDEEVLFFIRIRGKKSYFNMFYPEPFLKRFRRLKEYRTISEYKKDADVFIDINKYKYSQISSSEKEIIRQVLPVDEIIKRCRGLRQISYSESKELIFRCAKFFIELYSDSKIRLIVSGCVDNYVMDIMHRMASHYGINFLSITDFFLYPDYKLVTTSGEHNSFHKPSLEEIQNVYSALLNKRRSPLAISKYKSLKNAAWDFGSFYYRYMVRYLWKYKTLGWLCYEYRFAKYLKKFNNPIQLLGSRYLETLSPDQMKEISQNRNSYAYLPLHYFPEATIDYWTDLPENADYYQHLFDVIKYFEEKGVKLLVKEHPAYYLARPIEIYKKIKEYTNVTLLSPFINTQDILDYVDNVIIWNGSTGIESIMLDKKVYLTTQGYYSTSSFKNFSEFNKGSAFSIEEKKNVIRRVLETSIPTKPPDEKFLSDLSTNVK